MILVTLGVFVHDVKQLNIVQQDYTEMFLRKCNKIINQLYLFLIFAILLCKNCSNNASNRVALSA